MRHPLRLACILLCFLLAPGLPPEASAQVREGERLPALTLTGPASAQDAADLGVLEGKPFALTDIPTPFLLLQLFSMYCPHCQREAPHLKTMYETMVRQGLQQKIAVLGLGVGNSAYEVEYFRKQYAIPFHLIPDKDFAAYAATGRVGTPYYVLCARKDSQWKVLYLHEGAFENPQAFLDLILQKTGLAAAK